MGFLAYGGNLLKNCSLGRFDVLQSKCTLFSVFTKASQLLSELFLLHTPTPVTLERPVASVTSAAGGPGPTTGGGTAG